MVLNTINLYMIQKYNYWTFNKALTDRTCNHIIEYGKRFKSTYGTIGGLEQPDKLSKKQVNFLKDKRKSDVAWMDDTWIYKEIHPYVDAANKKAGWNFQWDASESCQFTKYNKGQYYGWHSDSWQEPYNKPNNPRQHKKIRKLSVTCQLSDASEYTGGDLEFRILDDATGKTKDFLCIEAKEKGSMIVFPSYVVHRVTPVKSGTRYSLVIWNLGHPFL